VNSYVPQVLIELGVVGGRSHSSIIEACSFSSSRLCASS